MIEELSFIGEPIQFTNEIFIYPPKIKDIIENDTLLQSYKILTYSQEDIIDLIEERKISATKTPTPLEFILANCKRSKQFENIVRLGLSVITKKTVSIGYTNKIIFIGDYEKISEINAVDHPCIINENNFFDFQNLIRIVFGDTAIKPYQEPENRIVARIRAKTRKRERKAKETKAKKGGSLLNSMRALCLMNCGVTPFNIGELTYLAFNSLISLYQSKEKYDKDIILISGGADPKKIKPKYWLNFNNSNEMTSKDAENLSQ